MFSDAPQPLCKKKPEKTSEKQELKQFEKKLNKNE